MEVRGLNGSDHKNRALAASGLDKRTWQSGGVEYSDNRGTNATFNLNEQQWQSWTQRS